MRLESIRFASSAPVNFGSSARAADSSARASFARPLAASAIPLITDAAKDLPKNAAVRYHHGMALAAKGRPKEARAELSAALALNPKFMGADEAKKTLSTLR